MLLWKILQCLAFGTSKYANASCPVRTLFNTIKYAMEATDHVLCSGRNAPVPVRGLYMRRKSIEIGSGVQTHPILF